MVHRHVALFLAFMVMGAAVPLTSQAVYRYDGMFLRSAAGDRPIRLRRTVTPHQRERFNKAMEIYDMLDGYDKGLVRPSLDDVNTINVYLEMDTKNLRYQEEIVEDPLSTTDYVAPAESAPKRELDQVNRAALRRAIHVRNCFMSLPTGLRELCESIVKGRKPRSTTGLQNDLIKGRAQHRQ